jgi:hypothetical protein
MDWSRVRLTPNKEMSLVAAAGLRRWNHHNVQQFDIEDEHVLQRGEQRAQEVHMVKGEMDLVPPA